MSEDEEASAVTQHSQCSYTYAEAGVYLHPDVCAYVRRHLRCQHVR